MRLEISRRGVQFLAPESLCSQSYEGLKVHVSQSTILEKCQTTVEFDAETYLKGQPRRRYILRYLGHVAEDTSPHQNNIGELSFREVSPTYSYTS